MRGKSLPSAGISGEKKKNNALVRCQHRWAHAHPSHPAAPSKAEHSLCYPGMSAPVGMATRDAVAGMAGQEFAIGRTGKCLGD